MSQDDKRTYKQRDNYPTGGFCFKREKCNAFLKDGINTCKDCLRYDKYFKSLDVGNDSVGNKIDFFA